MNIAVLDDDPLFFDYLYQVFQRQNDEIVFHCFQDSKSFLYALSLEKYDAAFLDVELPDFSGIEISKKVRSYQNDCMIVFITNHPETVFDAFGINVIAFVEKRNLEKEAELIWEKIISEKKNRSEKSFQLKNNRHIAIPIQSIAYLEISMRKVYLFTTDKHKYVLKNRNLSEVVLSIDHSSFVYINRSCVVNINHIRLLDSDHLYLFNYENPLYISRNQIQSVKKRYMNNR